MSRDWRLYWDDIIVACRKAQRYTAGLDKEKFRGDEKTYDAVLRNIEVMPDLRASTRFRSAEAAR